MSAAGDRKSRHLLFCALLGAWSLALAQDPPGEAALGGPDAGGTARPCLPAEEDPAPEAADGGTAAPPCDEPDDAAAADDADRGPAAVVEEDMAIEATADEVFKPGDEISEDYPIPLPSDI